jgi:glutamyl-tRNA synthetase
MAAEQTIRTRFAPSPSGHLHVGGARTALFGWAYARARGGRFILRIEDTDRKRSSEAASLGFLESLEWLGIGWDEGPEHSGNGGGEAGPYRQSERLDIYREHLERLLAAGRAYRAFETPEELEAMRAAAPREQGGFKYDGRARELDPATVERYLAEGRPHVVRFVVGEPREVVVEDVVRGDLRVSTTELDDFIIAKADGYPTYHFAVVVDDELMGVTHVIRGEEHLKNTIKHVLLQEALGFGRPVYAHLSLIFNPDGSKMSKRDRDKALRRAVRERDVTTPVGVDAETWSWWLESGDHQLDVDDATRVAEGLGVELPEIDVDDFRRAGYLPEVMVNYLALLGWSPGDDVEKFDVAFLTERFELDRIIKSPARFDRDKLLAFNLDALQALSPEAFAERLREHAAAYHPEFLAAFEGERFTLFATANQERSKTLEDPFRSCRFLVIDDADVTYQQTKAVRKALVNGEPNGYAHLEGVRAELAGLEPWTVESIEGVVRKYADARADGKLGKVAQPLRIAVSGGTVSPAIFETLVLVGRASVVARIDRCLATREVMSSAG